MLDKKILHVPHFIDIHELPGITSAIAAAEHIRDIDMQGPYVVNYSKYWLNEETGKLFCYCEAPTAEAAIEVHRLAPATRQIIWSRSRRSCWNFFSGPRDSSTRPVP